MSYRDRGGSGGHRPPRVSLVVRNLPLDIRVEDLRAKFEKYGELKDVYMPRDYYTQRPRGFGFVEFKDTRDAEDAMYSLDKSTVNGREISVTFSREGRKTPRDMMKLESRQKGNDDRYDDRRHDERDRDQRYDERRRSRSRSQRRHYSRSPCRSRTRSPRRSRERERERERSPHELSPRDRERDKAYSPAERYEERERDYERRPERGRSPSPRRESPRPEADEKR